MLSEIESELARLAVSADYRRTQKVLAEGAQFKNMKRALARCGSMSTKAALDFSRVVSDSASLDSRILQLAEQLVKATTPCFAALNPAWLSLELSVQTGQPRALQPTFRARLGHILHLHEAGIFSA